VLTSIGFPNGEAPAAALADVVERRSRSIDVPGVGRASVVLAPIEGDPGGHLVLARAGGEFSQEERNLLGGMTQVLALSLRTIRGLEAERKRLERVALTDNLTELRNHRAFQEDLDRELGRQARDPFPLSLVMLDLDGLKQVNDSLGHQAGDDRLMAVADCLADTLREGGAAAYRLGGDEFAAILAGEKAWGALRFVQRLQQNLATEPRYMGTTVTAGIADASCPTTKDTLIAQADLALIEAKRSRRSVLIYSAGLEPAVMQPDGEAERHHLQTLTTALARAVDAKDSYTRSHSETVSETCGLIAEELGLPPERVARLRLAGLLHDIGKIGIPDAILQKPAALTDEEFEVMKTHSKLGYRIVRGAELEQEAEWILHHHERLDGRGYPDGLSGDAVPLESRIILVADAFEAMTSDRPYRRGQPERTALAELARHAGTQFDPDAVAALHLAVAAPRELDDGPRLDVPSPPGVATL
jgi:diguanylate cyclase (GGDEF)-like protein/putative nucleotidyltransferase with HDIG domain